MITIRLPLDSARLRRGGFIDVAHHVLVLAASRTTSIDRGLELGQRIVALLFDDRRWLVEVVGLEFDLADTRYLMRVIRPLQSDPPEMWVGPQRGGAVTSRDVATLLSLLSRDRNESMGRADRSDDAALEPIPASCCPTSVQEPVLHASTSKDER